jgi:DNA-binding transcriptional LysR family regulator
MEIAIMRITHLRQADLNLLVVFTALAEERNVTRAASRLLLSQPAVSRALQRLREMFHDDLLIRSPSGYEPTPKGKRLLQELSTMLPRLDRLLSGEDFDPKVEEATFRIAVTDHASHVLCPLICRRVLPTAAKVSIEFVPFGDPTFDAIEKGRIDLMLNADDGYLPPRFASEMIFDDSFSCAAAKENKYPRVLTLKQYLAAQHVGVGIWGELQTLPDKRLAGIGEKRRCPIWVPYFTAAIRCVPGTPLLATVPSRLAGFESKNPALKILKPPEVLGRFNYLMAWHPRMNTDAAHIWLRRAIRETAKVLSQPVAAC